VINAIIRFSVPAAGLALSLNVAALGAAAADSAVPQVAPDARVMAALKDVYATRIEATIDKLVGFGTRSTLSAQDPASIKAGRGIGAAREWIKSEFERYSKGCGGCLEVNTDSFVQEPADRIPSPTLITNVYAMMRGTDPQSAKRIVLITGHYDSRNSDTFDVKGDAPGANDDGSGTAASLECARVLSRLKFPATLIFLAVAGEEQGLNGSKHFASMARQKGWNIEAVLNDDIVGGNRDPDQNTGVVRVFSEGVPAAADDKLLMRIRGRGGESDSASRELARYVAEAGAAYDTAVKPMLIFRPDRYLRGGDHSSFNEEGYAAVRFTEYRENFTRQHQDIRTENGIEFGDLPKFVDFNYLANVVRLNAAALAALAAAPAAPAKIALHTANLENDSTLSWEAPPSAAAFEVLWRSTTSPVWEHAKPVGRVTSVTLPISKDNVIFAVRAVDADGHRSLVAVPVL
jgi:hypothetical protein